MSSPIDLEAKATAARGLTMVVGFAFFGDEVLAIRHDKPGAGLHGRLNGIGGKVRLGEDPQTAMAREFAEETGYDGGEAWLPFCQLEHGPHVVFFFRCNLRRKFDPVQCSEGAVTWVSTETFNECNAKLGVIVPNLAWLVPMARQWNVTVRALDISLPLV